MGHRKPAIFNAQHRQWIPIATSPRIAQGPGELGLSHISHIPHIPHVPYIHHVHGEFGHVFSFGGMW
jgi:hypothetical protein